MKGQDGIETSLMPAFAGGLSRPAEPLNRASKHSTYGEGATARALADAQLSALRKQGR